VFTALALLIALALIASAVVSPLWFAVVALVTGALPTSLGVDQVFDTPLGRLDVAALRLFALLAGSAIVVAFQLRNAAPYAARSALHVAFLVFCVVSLGYAVAPVYGLRMLAKLIAPLLFLLALLATVRSLRDVELLNRAVLASGVLIGGLALATKILGINPDSRFNLPGMGPSVFSAHLMVVGMLAFATFLTRRKWLPLFFSLALLFSIVAAFTRITILAAFLGAAVVAVLALRGPIRIVLPLAGVVGGPALFLLSERFRSRMFIDSQAASVEQVLADPGAVAGNVRGSGRFALWDDLMSRFFEPRPAFGSGIGTTQGYLYESSGGIGVAHSDYVRLLCEVGLIGTGLFVAAMCVYLVRAIAANRRLRGDPLRAFPIAAAGGLVSYLVFMATDNGLDYVSQVGIYVFALVAMSEKVQAVPGAAPQPGGASATDSRLPNVLPLEPVRVLRRQTP
jgi:O-antigen ligase